MTEGAGSEAIGRVREAASLVGLAGGAGVVVGFLDCLRSTLESTTLMVTGVWLETLLNYLVFWSLLGLVLAAPAVLLFRSRGFRVVKVLLAVGSFTMLAVALANWYFLDGPVLSASRLGVDALVLALGAGAAFLLVRRGRGVGASRWWLATALVLLLVSGGLAAIPSGSGDGEVVATRISEDDPPPPVLLILVDTLRADHLSLHGYERDTSPNLDRFAQGAMVFDRARAESSWTKPSTATILTGLPPLVHGQFQKHLRVPDEAVTLAECFRSAGYATACFSDNPYVSPVFGFEQGFDHFFWHRWWDTSAFRRATSLGRFLQFARIPDLRAIFSRPADLAGFRAGRMNDEFLRWLDERESDEPWFAYLHYLDPHEPYRAPGEWFDKYLGPDDDPGLKLPNLDKNRYRPWQVAKPLEPGTLEHMIALYDAEIAYWDHCFGELMRELGKRGVSDELVILITSDHGEEFYEHGGYSHGQTMFEEMLHVPLLVRAPGVEPGRVSAAVSNASVFPTVLKLAGLELASDPVFPLPEGLVPRPTEDRIHFAANEPNKVIEQWSLVRSGVKWILSRRNGAEVLECFLLDEDPGEKRPTPPDQTPRGKLAIRELGQIASLQRAMTLLGGGADISEDMKEALRGLGYMR